MVKDGRCVRLTIYRHSMPLSRNLGTLISWNPLGLSRPVMWLFYILPLHFFNVGLVGDWLRAGRSGIESRWGRDFPPVQTGRGAHLVSCERGTRSFPGVKFGRGVLLTTDLLLVPRSWKGTAIPLHRACNGIILPSFLQSFNSIMNLKKFIIILRTRCKLCGIP